jgi:hypothetical protein
MEESQKERRLRRRPAAEYLEKEWGIRCAPATLASWACKGTGPEIEYFSRFPYYWPSALDAWARAALCDPTTQARKRRRREASNESNPAGDQHKKNFGE